jgi:hypothetical protein
MGLSFAKGSDWFAGTLAEHSSPGDFAGFEAKGCFHWHHECQEVNDAAWSSAQGRYSPTVTSVLSM